MLGLAVASRDSSCELQGLLLGRQCEHAARACCGKNTNEETKADDKGKKPLLCLDELYSALSDKDGHRLSDTLKTIRTHVLSL